MVSCNTRLEEHSVEHITSNKRRYPTAQLICVFVCLTLTFDLELLQLTQLLPVVYVPSLH